MTLTDDDLAPVGAPADSELATVAALAQRQVDLEDAIAARREELKTLGEALRQVSEVDLPAAMGRAGPSGLSSFTLGNGYVVHDALRYRCGQLDDGPDKRPRDNDDDEPRRPLIERLKAFLWLDKNGHGDIAKNVISVAVGKDEIELVEEIMNWLRAHRAANRMVVDRRRTVAWNTLSAFAKDLDQQTLDPPLELLGVSKGHVAKVTRPKS
jgi:hypothetical protein